MRLFKGRKFSFAALGRGESIFAQSLPLPALVADEFIRATGYIESFNRANIF